MRGRIASSAAAAAVLCATASRADPPAGPRDVLAARFASDTAAQRLALTLFDAEGDDVDTLPAQSFDGGYRGTIPLVPALPVGGDRKHLAWVADALNDFGDFFAALGRAHPAAPPLYRWQRLSLHFFRSVGNTTPNAFAWRWDVAYNVHGSLEPGNDAREYAAEVATRFYVENRAAAAGEPRAQPRFKCGPPENRAAWDALKSEFFGGVDLIPPC